MKLRRLMPLGSFISIAMFVVQSATGAAQQPPAASPKPPAAPAQSPPPEQSLAPAKPAAPAGQGAAPLTLENAGQLALQQASAFQQALTDERIAALDVTQARAALLPKLRSTSTYTLNKPLTPHTNDPSFIAQNAVREYESLVGAEGSLDFGLHAAVRRSRGLLAAAHAGTEIARRELVRSLREAYYGLALATAKRRSAEESLTAAEEFERVTTLQNQGGEVAEVDVLRARLQSAQRRDDLEGARLQETIAAAGLRVLIGYTLEDALSVSDLTPAPSAADLEPFAHAVTASRPELAQARAQLGAARADVGVARAERLPSLTYSADRGFDSPALRPDDIRQHSGYLVSANLRIPLFDWGAARAHQRQAELRAEAARRQLVLTTRDLEQQYLRAWEAAQSAVRRAANARTALADAQRNADISIARYRAGEASVVEVTDALTTLAQQRVSLQQSLFDFEVARAQLKEGAGE